MTERPRFQIANHTFGISKASVTIEIGDAAEAARTRVPHAHLSIEVDGVPADMPGVPSSVSWFSPKAYLDYPLALSELGIRSCADLSFSSRARSALYTYKHQTLGKSNISLVDADGDLQLEWTGETIVGLEVVPVHIVARPKFGGINVYSHDPREARAWANAVLPVDDLEQVEVDIRDPGRRKYVLFGPIVGRAGRVRFMPRARAVVAPWTLPP